MDWTSENINSSSKHLKCYYSLLLGIPAGAALDLLSTTRDSCFTASLDRMRGWLRYSPPSTTNVVPLTYFPNNPQDIYIQFSVHGNIQVKWKEKGKGIILKE